MITHGLRFHEKSRFSPTFSMQLTAASCYLQAQLIVANNNFCSQLQEDITEYFTGNLSMIAPPQPNAHIFL
jgi:uncharacterized protein with NAD-binding domain and iron-sulfur cluster